MSQMKFAFLTSGMMLAFAAYSSFSVSDAYSKLLAGQLDPFEVAFSGGVFGFLIIPFIRRPSESYLDIFAPQHPGMWVVRAVATFAATAASVEAFMLLPCLKRFRSCFSCRSLLPFCPLPCCGKKFQAGHGCPSFWDLSGC